MSRPSPNEKPDHQQPAGDKQVNAAIKPATKYREIVLNGSRLFEYWDGKTWMCYRVEKA